MADFVQHVKNILRDEAGDFMQLDSICFPPIDFADALKKARQDVLVMLGEHGRVEGRTTEKVLDNEWVTFSYLMMQLHVRGSQDFWQHVDEKQLWAYLFFRVADIYADVLTHVPAGSVDAPALFRASLESMADVRARFSLLLGLIRAQRQGKDGTWRPAVAEVQSVMSAYADERLKARVLQGIWRGAAVAGVVAGVVALGALLYLRARRSS